jgi:hypothetical protein
VVTRLYFIVARDAPVAVVFRRGPSRQVELLRWDFVTDELLAGQWLKGRIYERRADLSPSGDLLIYFAAKFETKVRTWTAISRPPYLTALAFWPKGDAWGGGGLFNSERDVLLNHRPGTEMTLGDGSGFVRSLRVEPFGFGSGWGEDDPILHARLVRDGWHRLDDGAREQERAQGSKVWITFTPPIRYRRSVGPRARPLTLEMSLEGIKERDGAWYVLTWRLLDGETVVRELGRADWADAAPTGDLLLARDGRLLRVDATALGDPAAEVHEVADLRDHRFEARVAPAEAVASP